MTQTEMVVMRWITFATKEKLRDRLAEMWLFLDYLSGAMSDDYYRRHAREAMAALDRIDVRKGENARVVEEIRRRVEVWI